MRYIDYFLICNISYRIMLINPTLFSVISDKVTGI